MEVQVPPGHTPTYTSPVAASLIPASAGLDVSAHGVAPKPCRLPCLTAGGWPSRSSTARSWKTPGSWLRFNMTRHLDCYGRVAMLVGHDRRNSGDTDDRDRGRPPDHSISRCHRTPPQQKNWSGQLRHRRPWLQVGQRGRSPRGRSAGTHRVGQDCRPACRPDYRALQSDRLALTAAVCARLQRPVRGIT